MLIINQIFQNQINPKYINKNTRTFFAPWVIDENLERYVMQNNVIIKCRQ